MNKAQDKIKSLIERHLILSSWSRVSSHSDRTCSEFKKTFAILQSEGKPALTRFKCTLFNDNCIIEIERNTNEWEYYSHVNFSKLDSDDLSSVFGDYNDMPKLKN